MIEKDLQTVGALQESPIALGKMSGLPMTAVQKSRMEKACILVIVAGL